MFEVRSFCTNPGLYRSKSQSDLTRILGLDGTVSVYYNISMSINCNLRVDLRFLRTSPVMKYFPIFYHERLTL